jgi:hypothetical protein
MHFEQQLLIYPTKSTPNPNNSNQSRLIQILRKTITLGGSYVLKTATAIIYTS